MTALVTGASSGIGRDIARKLGSMGVRLIITGRDKESLEALRQELGARRVKVIAADISRRDECLRLYREASAYDVDILVNNAGVVDSGIEAVLTKLFLRDFSARDKGYILNVASIAGFMPGPLMATYYATKNYVLRLTEAVREELRCQRSGVYIGAFCPGPVDTHFNSTAGVKFALRGISSEYAAECAVRGMFARKALILPTSSVKAAAIASRFIPDMLLAAIARLFQSRKG